AAGVVVRAIAPCLGSKLEDPAVVVCDPAGRFAVSLVSGHVGGANDLARRAAEALGGQAVITTASDACGLPALDELARKAGLAVTDQAAARRAARALLEAETLQLHDPLGLLGLTSEHIGAHFRIVDDPEAWDPEKPGAWVHWRSPRDIGVGLLLRPERFAAGIGCRRGASTQDILTALDATLRDAGLARESLTELASIDLKRDEPGLVAAAEELGLTIRFYSADELDGVELAGSSARVKRHTGTGSVCEAAAILASRGGKLAAGKQIHGPATAAVAVCSW
ncbi:MAG: cobalt-precorrin 5A hydrolase, partial [Desulfovibrionaceae bacterium]